MLLVEVKEMMKLLVPRSEHVFIEEGLDVELIMQQLQKGVVDIGRLVHSCCEILKTQHNFVRSSFLGHIRDKFERGCLWSDAGLVLTAFGNLLDLLQLMNFDAAHRFIQRNRDRLIETTIQFEQSAIVQTINSGHLDIASVIQWYQRAVLLSFPGLEPSSSLFGTVDTFFGVLLRLLMPSSSNEIMPPTFFHDQERLALFRTEILDCINLNICMRLFEDMGGYEPRPLRVNPEQFIIGRSSAGPGHVPLTSGGSMTTASKGKADREVVLESLIALIWSDDLKCSPWEDIIPIVAKQMFSSAVNPSGTLYEFEERVRSMVSDVSSSLYQETERVFHRRLTLEVARRVSEFKKLSALGIYRTMMRSNEERRKKVNDMASYGHVRNMAQKIAHLGILHYRVWKPIVYDRSCLRVQR
jgi:hypothetical protein